MAITNTPAFNLDVAEIVEEAFEQAGSEVRTANDLRTARRSLNLMLLDWSVRGINLWTLDEQSVPLVAGTAAYNIDINTMSILDAVIRQQSGSSGQTDFTCPRLSFSTYADYPNKLQQGRPLNYWFDRIGIRNETSSTDRLPRVIMWPVPDNNTYSFVYWRMRKMSEVGNAGNHVEVPDRFLPALVAGLAFNIALKKPELSGRAAMLEARYEKLFDTAFTDDRVKEDLRLVPDNTGYGRNF